MACKHCKPAPPLVAVWIGAPVKWCNVAKGCKRKVAFFLCGGDGKARTSRLRFTSCAVHLPLAVRKMHKEQGTRGPGTRSEV